MTAPRSHDMLVKAARLYYLEDRSQADVAKTLGVSRSSVSRILSAAREQGIVEIRIHDPGVTTRAFELEEAVQRTFGIRWALVVWRPRGRPALEVVAEAAARLFESRVAGLESFGLSWGVTVQKFVEQVEPEPVHASLKICPLVGGMPSAGPAGNVSLEVLAAKSGAVSFRFESPSVVESPRTWAALTRESSVRDALARAAAVQLAFVGIGSYGLHNSRTVVDAMKLSPDEAADLARQDPAGDICGRFFDLDGRPLGRPTSERIIGITLDQLRDVPEVVGLAAGVEKAPGVVGALRTGTLDGIVMDEDLARAVLSRAS